MQIVKDVYTDCDNDVILLKVQQVGGIACHTGRESCFFQKINGEKLEITKPVIKDPKEIYG
jgi:phosphoribosyl-AMP cyclohydrolase